MGVLSNSRVSRLGLVLIEVKAPFRWLPRAMTQTGPSSVAEDR